MSTTAHDLDAQLEDLERVKQEALGQRDAIYGHTDDALVLLANVRLCAEQLEQARVAALRRLDTIPGFDAELPEDASPFADLNLSEAARTLLSTFNDEKLADLHAGLDAAEGAINRYRDRVEAEYERFHGEPVGWRPAVAAIAAAPSDALQAVLDGKCPADDCGRAAHGFVRVTEDGIKCLHPAPAPAPYLNDECCSSGSCEVCRGIVR